jgi:hypothetical protein
MILLMVVFTVLNVYIYSNYYIEATTESNVTYGTLDTTYEVYISPPESLLFDTIMFVQRWFGFICCMNFVYLFITELLPRRQHPIMQSDGYPSGSDSETSTSLSTDMSASSFISADAGGVAGGVIGAGADTRAGATNTSTDTPAGNTRSRGRNPLSMTHRPK